MDYRTSVPFSGDVGKAIGSAGTILATLGFAVTPLPGPGLDARGPGMRSTNQNPVLGATRLTIVPTAGTLALEAELGGVRFMRRFVMWFPPLLVVGITLVNTLVFALAMPGSPAGRIAWFPVLFILPWPLLGTPIGRLIEKRTTRALDVLLANVAGVGAAR